MGHNNNNSGVFALYSKFNLSFTSVLNGLKLMTNSQKCQNQSANLESLLGNKILKDTNE